MHRVGMLITPPSFQSLFEMFHDMECSKPQCLLYNKFFVTLSNRSFFISEFITVFTILSSAHRPRNKIRKTIAMETMTNLASAASNTVSRAIWGEQESIPDATKTNETRGEEPLSGKTGNVAAGEPYDMGNSGGGFLDSYSSRCGLIRYPETSSMSSCVSS